MKNLLKFGIAILLIFVFTGSQAQVRFGIKGGMNLSTMKFAFSGISIDPKSLVGFHLGAIAEFGVTENLKIQPGLLYSSKGSKFEADGESVSFVPNYIEVPVNVAYMIGLGGVKISINAGPYLGYAIGGKWKYDDGTSEDISIGTNAEEDEIKPLDIGVNLGASVYFGSVFLTAQYGLGLSNVSAYTAEDTQMKIRAFGLSVGYLFGGK